LSYKFQRLREQLRSAVLSGEFRDRLPGERQLGRRFNANAKTINKALCDLARDGLLTRQIGRGTFVTGPGSTGSPATKQYRIMMHGSEADAEVARCVGEVLASRGHRLEAAVNSSTDRNRTLLSSWPLAMRRATDGILYLALDPFAGENSSLDESSAAEIMRRHLAMVIVGSQSSHAKLSNVSPDYSDAGFRLCEHLIQMGCRRIVVAQDQGDVREAELVACGAAAAAARHGYPLTRVCMANADEISVLINQVSQGTKCNCDPRVGPTGVVCIGSQIIATVSNYKEVCDAHSNGHVHLACAAAPGSTLPAHAATYEVSLHRLADWAARLITDAHAGDRPVEVLVPGVVRPVSWQRDGQDEMKTASRTPAGSESIPEIAI
jgi:DNA-binding LacI/PurR family transcriptional regulator